MRNKADHPTIQAYIADYDLKYNRIKNKGMTLPVRILAFNLIKRAKLSVNKKKAGHDLIRFFKYRDLV